MITKEKDVASGEGDSGPKEQSGTIKYLNSLLSSRSPLSGAPYNYFLFFSFFFNLSGTNSCSNATVLFAIDSKHKLILFATYLV